MKVGSVAAGLVVLGTSTAGAAQLSVEQLQRMSIDELVNVEVTSVSKRAEPISQAAAAIFVITNEEIRRSGYRTLPEVLRLAPNLHVARLDSHQYAIGARGFTTFEASNKLLVLIDGRSVYTPLHAGVFWDQQQVMVEDIERIEVISGPGGTLWGANAVNGVINILTKKARDTTGGLASAQVGNRDDQLAARYGGQFGESGGWRVYGVGTNQGNSVTTTGRNAKDDYVARQAGFRLDWGEFTFQGDLWENNYDIAGLDDRGDNRGGNVLGRWTRQLGDDSSVMVQAYYDRVDRRLPNVTDKLETLDIEAQHSFAIDKHSFVWGAGYRSNRDEFRSGPGGFRLDPEQDTTSIAHLFAQDTIKLNPDLSLTAGIKLEHNSISGFEWMPSARLGWTVDATNFLWAAVSRVVRTPSRVDRDLSALPIFEQSDLRSEKLIAYELGWRGRPTSDVFLSASLYWHEYDDLRVITQGDTALFEFGNAMHGHIYGLEAWGDYRVLDWWRLSAGVNLLHKNLRLDPGATELAIDQHAGNDPEVQLMLRSAMNVSESIEIDVGMRYVGALPEPSVSDYFAVDARLGWHATEALELSLVGLGIFDRRHAEIGQPQNRREIPSGFYAAARLKF